MKLIWTAKHFSELSSTELYEILQLRSDVFVIEQKCVYRDLDDKDQTCYHLLGRVEETGELVAYSRIVPPGVSYEEPSIGRVLTALKSRKNNFGRELMRKSIQETQLRYPGKSIRIGAQTYLTKFYASLGFVEQGKPYDEDGIEHIEMVLAALVQ